jgi:hypothetical protein
MGNPVWRVGRGASPRAPIQLSLRQNFTVSTFQNFNLVRVALYCPGQDLMFRERLSDSYTLHGRHGPFMKNFQGYYCTR